MTDMGENVTVVGMQQTVHEVKKHVATIHCSNGLSLLQRKISNALLYHAYDSLMTREEHEITVRELCRLIGYQGNNHSVMRDALKGLLATVIEWNVVNDVTGDEDWTASSILASVSMKGPVCFYAYSPRMKQLLHSPAMFAKINLFIQSRFKSSYGLALYENCLRYRGLGFTKWLEMDVFRKLMGVPSDKYTLFRDFKRRVLDKSVEEVNTYSDLFVEPEIRREGRRVVQLRFLLKERARKVRIGGKKSVDGVTENNHLTAVLAGQFGLSLKQARNVLDEYSETFIREKIELVVSSRNYQQGKVKNHAAYLMSALRNDYQASGSGEKNEHWVHSEREWVRQVEAIRRAWQDHREVSIDAGFASLPEEHKLDLIKEFREQSAVAIQTVLRLQRKKYTVATILDSPQIKALFRQYVIENSKEISNLVGSFEIFLQSLSEDHQAAWLKLIEKEADQERMAII